jgi:hypothetical protein
MIDLPTLRRRMLAAAIIGTASFTLAPALSPTPAIARESRIPSSFCRHDWRHGRREIKRLIRCSARRWHVPGGAHKAIVVVRRESRFHPRAYNPAGYKGLFQQSVRYWRARARRYGFPGWSAYNGRANVIVSIRMVHRGGWGPWSTA